jgi:ABC-type antimicrobial peptide transport system permease subunit
VLNAPQDPEEQVCQMDASAAVIPVEAWSGGIAGALLTGVIAGLLPAVRASRMPPTAAL